MSLPDIRGELMTIYDAEDLTRSTPVAAGGGGIPAAANDVGCLQDALSFYNERENLSPDGFPWSTRNGSDSFFLQSKRPTAWSHSAGPPITCPPRSGTKWAAGMNSTSPKTRTSAYRLARSGYRTMILDSETLEEATADVSTGSANGRAGTGLSPDHGGSPAPSADPGSRDRPPQAP